MSKTIKAKHIFQVKYINHPDDTAKYIKMRARSLGLQEAKIIIDMMHKLLYGIQSDVLVISIEIMEEGMWKC